MTHHDASRQENSSRDLCYCVFVETLHLVLDTVALRKQETGHRQPRKDDTRLEMFRLNVSGEALAILLVDRFLQAVQDLACFK